jgi:hypothetical protein
MYAKILRVAGGTEIPMLMVTAPPESVGELHARGWSPWGGRLSRDRGAVVRIMPDRLRITVNGVAILDDPDGDPVSPPGWWELVSRIGDRVVVALVPQETPFDEDGLKAMHSRLLDSPDTALAIVPVVHR